MNKIELLKTNAICLLIVLTTSCSTNPEENTNSGNAFTPDTTAVFAPKTKDAEKKAPIENGEHIEKYPSGIIKMKGEYAGGKRHGTWLSFYPDGKMWSEGGFKNGVRHGIAKTFHPNGNKNYEGFYTNGKESGVWKFYNESGEFVKEINYDEKK